MSFNPQPAKQKLSKENHKIRAILLGDAGTGKTTSALTIPGKKLYVDMDLRDTSIDYDISNVDVISFKGSTGWADLFHAKDKMLQSVRDGLYDAIIMDSITSMSRLCMDYIRRLDDSKISAKMKTGFGGVPEQYHYNAVVNHFPSMIHFFLSFPCHIVFCGHLDLHQDRITQATEWLPLVTGKIRHQISSWFDESYLCTKVYKGSKKQHQWLTNGSHNKAFFKSSLNALDRYWKDPIIIDFEAPGPKGFELLLEKRFGKDG